MSRAIRLLLLPAIVATAALPKIRAAEDAAFNATIAKAVLDYGERVQAATKELAEARVRIANARTPIMDEIRAAEARTAQLEAEVAALNIEQARTQEKLQSARADQVLLDRNLGYVTNIILDGFKSYEGNRLPGEAAAQGDTAAQLRNRIETTGHPADALAALDAAELFLGRAKTQLGGYTAPGTSLRNGSNEILEGTFAYLGPVVLFQDKAGTTRGLVRERKDSEYVVTYPLPDWTADQAQALFRGQPASLPVDPSGGKALQLRETSGNLWKEVQKGGIVGYVILTLGAIAVTITLMKLNDLRQLDVDSPVTMHNATSAVLRGSRSDAEGQLAGMRKTTRELFATGLRYLDAPRELLEEQFESFVLRHRLVQERRLQLLAVIATAGPLLGLLGTVTGMIKTFTLITVFGTGSAGRLSGGISEALVATALGLTVAIPTLVIHGFLSHRIHKGLALLERYSLEFVTAVEERRSGQPPKPEA